MFGYRDCVGEPAGGAGGLVGGAEAQTPQLAANLAAALRPKVRVRMDLAYDGTFFRGWAAQPGLRTVQGELTEALSTILRVPVQLTVAGRTDAGVHASHQVVHFDVDTEAWQALAGRNGVDPAQALRRRTQALLKRAATPKLPRARSRGWWRWGRARATGLTSWWAR